MTFCYCAEPEIQTDKDAAGLAWIVLLVERPD